MNKNNRIHNIFDGVRAEEDLKQKTANFLYEKIRQKKDIKKTIQLRLATVCASFVLLFILGGFSYNLYFTPNAYVDIDVNPSIELSVNRFGRVIEAYPYNDDGMAVLQDTDVRHMSYEDAVDKLLVTMAANGYLKQDGIVSATVQTSDLKKEKMLISTLQSAIDSSLENHHIGADSNVFTVSEDVRNHAHDNHMTPAKYLAILELQKIDPVATFDDWRGHSIGEIHQTIQGHGAGHGADYGNKGNNISEESEKSKTDHHEAEGNRFGEKRPVQNNPKSQNPHNDRDHKKVK